MQQVENIQSENIFHSILLSHFFGYPYAIRTFIVFARLCKFVETKTAMEELWIPDLWYMRFVFQTESCNQVRKLITQLVSWNHVLAICLENVPSFFWTFTKIFLYQQRLPLRNTFLLLWNSQSSLKTSFNFVKGENFEYLLENRETRVHRFV